MKARLLALARRYLPVTARRRIVRLTRWPPVGFVRFGSLRRLKPISPDWGLERGTPIDRYYIDAFLAAHTLDIRGRVLEIGDNTYTRHFGGDAVVQSDVLHVAEAKEHVTIIGDLTDAAHIPSESFDCLILTQTLQTIFDVPAVVQTLFRLLKPGGVALVTTAGISKISRYDMDRWGYYWSFTTRSLERLFAAAFPADHLEVEAHGNVLSAIAFLHGIAAQELRRQELDFKDPDFELLLTVRATRPARPE